MTQETAATYMNAMSIASGVKVPDVDHDADTEQYFSLIVGCAKEVIRNAADYTRPYEFWSVRIGAEWGKAMDALGRLGDRRRKYTMEEREEMTISTLSRLAQETQMAAWALALYALAGDDDPQNLECKLTTQSMNDVSGA